MPQLSRLLDIAAAAAARDGDASSVGEPAGQGSIAERMNKSSKNKFCR
jgi:hypothetical protein